MRHRLTGGHRHNGDLDRAFSSAPGTPTLWQMIDPSVLQHAELTLLRGPSRHDANYLEAVLHDDFIEIGRSGSRWTKAEVIVGLLAEVCSAEPVVDEWHSTRLSPALALLTYRLTGPGGVQSRHSSIWDTSGRLPILRFHQGTQVT